MCSTQGHGTNGILLESCARSQGIATFERMLEPLEGSPATRKSVAEIINLVVADLFGTGGTEMEQRVLAKLWNSTLVQKTGMTCTSQDQALRLVKEGRLRNWRRFQPKRT